MFGSSGNASQPKRKQQKQERDWFAVNFKPENFIPGLIIGFILGFFLDLSKSTKNQTKHNNSFLGKRQLQQKLVSSNSEEELKMKLVSFESVGHLFSHPTWLGEKVPETMYVLVVRQDLKMGAGKIASQCAHAATGMYAELIQCQRSLLRQWEQCGQAKIVVTCKNQQEMNKLKEAAESIGLPTYLVADAGRTQVSSGSKTVLAIGPGSKASVDSVTGKLRLL